MLLERFLLCVKIALIFLAVSVDCKKRRNRKRDHYADEPMPEEEQYNICNIQQPKIIYCYCDSLIYNKAKEGNCWIFNDTSDKKEFPYVWEGFSSQNRIKSFTLHLRPDGTVKTIPTVAIMHLRELILFEIQYATINTVHSFAFANSTTVSKVYLSRNEISVLEKHSFSNMANLTTLNLGHNNLTEINRDVFTSLPKLTQLFIDTNNLTRIADYAFHDLRTLKELELFSNQIRVIVPATFIGLEKLELLYLQKNFIEVIGDKTFQYLKSLTVLDLNSNSIKYIAPKGFYQLKKLGKLSLQDNKLLSLGSDVFANTNQLSYLNLQQNVLETLSEDTMKPIKSILHQRDTFLGLKGNIFRCDTRLLWLFTLYNKTKSPIIKDNLEEVYCYLETGTLPPRLENDPVPTPIYEVTTYGIGPRAQLLKLLPSELPDPLIRTPATFTEDCDEELKATMKSKGKKFHRNHKGSKRNKSKLRHKSSTTQTPTISEDIKNPQNDMATSEVVAGGGSSPQMRPAAPVQEAFDEESNSCSIISTAFTYILLLQLSVRYFS